MHPVSKFALAVALGAFSMVSATHAADDKDKAKAAAAAQTANFSPGFLKVYQPVAQLLVENDNKNKPLKPEKVQENYAKAKAAWPSVLAAAVNDNDKAEAGRFAFNVGRKLSDEALTRQGVDLAYASPAFAADQRAVFAYLKGEYAFSAKDYASAERFMIEGYNAGYRGAEVEYRISLALFNQKKYADIFGWMEKAIATKTAAKQPIPALWYAVIGEAASNTGDSAAANSYYAQMVGAENKSSYWYAALETYRRTNGTDGEPLLDLYRLMRRTGALNTASYEEYINILDQHRYPTETLAVIGEGLAANKLGEARVAQAKSRAEEKVTEYVASLPETEASARTEKDGFSAMLAGDDYLSNGDNAKAVELYTLALSRGPIKSNAGADVTDEATFRLGIAKLGSNDVAGAKAEFGKLGSSELAALANYWLIHIRHLESGKPAA